ncbi:major facilitator superfamily domain-containing protein [Pseudomassariella vexata]|uniref:Major facilitator superfamily domain-containing protein n=1 Tax=Pseudomassariella vexata TaxID=1141098 RepID=A0A1Y2E4W5_9PEZI|nr:major facilitator superfamily domain-containing protein [Pseudomassariella vexata]ORY66591.1 major facilitator superfamily domain-containing protein [Pseudomassariella vexata]
MDEKQLQVPTAPNPIKTTTKIRETFSRDLDDAYELYRRQDSTDIDPDEARRVLKKIDWHVLPILMMTYMLQFLDKSSINFASVYGLKQGTNLHGQDYSWLSSIFYFGYLFAQYPAGYLLQRLPIGKFIGSTAIGWGILVITTPACSSFAGIATNRFLLGVTEAVVNPGFVLIMAMWYKQQEQPLRLVTYYSMNGVAGIFGGLLGYAIGHITSGLPQWMYVFLIFGSISLTWGIGFVFLMPDIPSSARFLTEAEKVVAVERVAANRQGVKNHHFKRYQMWQAVRDPKTWILLVMSIAAQIPNAAQTSFTSIVLETFGFDVLETQYMQIPGSVIQIVSLLASGYISSRFPNMRCVTMLVGNTICVICGAALVGLSPGPDGTDNKWGRLVALWLCSFQSVGFSMSLTMVSSNVAGYTKKQITGAFLFVGYCIGNIIGPQTFINNEAPFYHSAYIAILIGYSVKTVMVVVLYLFMWSVNKKRDREAATSGHLTAEEEKAAIEAGMQDVTEIDNKGFRYVL